MKLSMAVRQMLALIAATVAIITFVALVVDAAASARWQSGLQTSEATSAIADVCLGDLGPWKCLERLEDWGSRVTEGAVATPYAFRDRRAYRDAVLGSLVALVPAAGMLKACPLPRRDACAARLIEFGYDRSETISVAGKE